MIVRWHSSEAVRVFLPIGPNDCISVRMELKEELEDPVLRWFGWIPDSDAAIWIQISEAACDAGSAAELRLVHAMAKRSSEPSNGIARGVQARHP